MSGIIPEPPVTAIWPPSPIDPPPEPLVDEEIVEQPEAAADPQRMTPSDWLAIIAVGLVALLIWATAAFLLMTTLLRWSQGASFAQCVDEANNVHAQPALCLVYPGR